MRFYFLLILFLGSCHPAQENKVRVAFVGSLTGKYATEDLEALNGVKVAVNQINETGFDLNGKNYKVELLIADDKNNAQLAVKIAKDLVKAGVRAVIGHTRATGNLYASPIYSSHKVVKISPLDSSFRVGGLPYCFNLVADNFSQAEALLSYIKGHQFSRVAVININSAYGNNMKKALAKVTGNESLEIKNLETVDESTLNFSPILKKMGDGFDALIFTGGPLQSENLIRQMRQNKITAQLLLTASARRYETIKSLGYMAENVVTTDVINVYDLPEKIRRDFEHRYANLYLKLPQNSSYYGYDAMNLIVEGIKEVNSLDSEKLSNWFYQNVFEGTSGEIRFDMMGNRKLEQIPIYRVSHGKWKLIEKSKTTLSNALP